MKILLFFLLFHSVSSFAISVPCDGISSEKYFYEPEYTTSEYSIPDRTLVDVSVTLTDEVKSTMELSAYLIFISGDEQVLSEIIFAPKIKDNSVKFSLSTLEPKTTKAIIALKLYTGGCAINYRREYQFNKNHNEMDGSDEPPI